MRYQNKYNTNKKLVKAPKHMIQKELDQKKRYSNLYLFDKDIENEGTFDIDLPLPSTDPENSKANIPIYQDSYGPYIKAYKGQKYEKIDKKERKKVYNKLKSKKQKYAKFDEQDNTEKYEPLTADFIRYEFKYPTPKQNRKVHKIRDINNELETSTLDSERSPKQKAKIVVKNENNRREYFNGDHNPLAGSKVKTLSNKKAQKRQQLRRNIKQDLA